MRTKTLLSLLVLCGSTAAIAGVTTAGPLAVVQDNATNEVDDTVANDTLSNSTDVEPSSEPDPTSNGTETAPDPNSTAY